MRLSIDSVYLRASLERLRARFAADRRGATAVEFAIVVAPFFGFMVLILQVGLFHFSLQSLDFAVRQAGRAVMTGNASATAGAEGFKTANICPKVFFTIDCGKVVLNAFRVGKTSDATASTGVYAHINATARQLNDPVSDPKKQSFCLGGPGDYILIDAAYPYPNFVRRLLSNKHGDSWLMRSTTMIYNEPSAKTTGGAC